MGPYLLDRMPENPSPIAPAPTVAHIATESGLQGEITGRVKRKIQRLTVDPEQMDLGKLRVQQEPRLSVGQIIPDQELDAEPPHQ